MSAEIQNRFLFARARTSHTSFFTLIFGFFFFPQRHRAPRAGRVSATDGCYARGYGQYLSRFIADAVS